MAGLEDGGVGSARRRRDRQLRAFGRHEQLTVRMELAAALHHSAQRVEGPREGEVHEKHDGLRAQKRPLPGTRPAPLAEVAGPQVRAATVGYVTAADPRLAGQRLKSDDDGVDGSTVRFLLQQSLAGKMKEEEEEEEEEEEDEGGGGGGGAAADGAGICGAGPRQS